MKNISRQTDHLNKVKEMCHDDDPQVMIENLAQAVVQTSNERNKLEQELQKAYATGSNGIRRQLIRDKQRSDSSAKRDFGYLVLRNGRKGEPIAAFCVNWDTESGVIYLPTNEVVRGVALATTKESELNDSEKAFVGKLKERAKSGYHRDNVVWINPAYFMGRKVIGNCQLTSLMKAIGAESGLEESEIDSESSSKEATEPTKVKEVLEEY